MKSAVMRRQQRIYHRVRWRLLPGLALLALLAVLRPPGAAAVGNVVETTPLVPSQTVNVAANRITQNDYIQFQYTLTGGWYGWLTVTDVETQSLFSTDRWALATSLNGNDFTDMTDSAQVLSPAGGSPTSFTSGRANITRCAGALDTTVYWRVKCVSAATNADCDFSALLQVKACNARIASVAPSNGPSYGGNRLTVFGDDLLRGAGDLSAADATVVGRALAQGNVLSVAADRSSVVLSVPDGTPRGLGEVALRSATHGPSRLAASYRINEPIALAAILPFANGPAAGSTVSVSGSGFLTDDATAAVTLGGLATANLTLYTDRVVFGSPAAASGGLAYDTPYDLVYSSTRSGVWTMAKAWTWNPPLSFARIAPIASGPRVGGNLVTFVGQGFFVGDETLNITIGARGLRFTNVTVVSSTATTAIAPAMPSYMALLAPQNITLESTHSASLLLPAAYYYNPTMTLSSVSPFDAPYAGGIRVTLAGLNFTDTDPSLVVRVLNAASATTLPLVSRTSRELVVSVPPCDESRAVACQPGALASLQIFSDSGGYTTRPAGFRWNVPLRLAALQPFPNVRAAGDGITLAGAGFITDDAFTVTIGVPGNPVSLAPLTVVDAARIDATVPPVASVAGAAVETLYNLTIYSYRGGTLVVPNAIKWNRLATFGALRPYSDANAITGAYYTMSGDGFLPGGSFSVKVGDLDSLFATVENGALVFQMPQYAPGPTSRLPVPISVFTSRSGALLVNNTFSWNPDPIFYNVFPTLSANGLVRGRFSGGQNFTVNGRNFFPSAISTTIADVATEGGEVLSETQFTWVSPRCGGKAEPGIPYPVVTKSVRFGPINKFFFQWDRDVVWGSITPTDGPRVGSAFTITGRYFIPPAEDKDGTLLVGGKYTIPYTVSPDGTKITVQVPALPESVLQAQTQYDVTLSSWRMGSNTYPLSWAWNDFGVIASVVPASGPLPGGNYVTLLGSNLLDGAEDALSFTLASNRVDAAAIVSATALQVVFRAPDGIGPGLGPGDIVLESRRYGLTRKPSAYTYVAGTPSPSSIVFVTRLLVDYERFDLAASARLRATLAAQLSISGERVVFADKRNGSTIVTVEIREATPEAQAAGAASNSVVSRRVKEAIAAGLDLGPEFRVSSIVLQSDRELSSVNANLLIGVVVGVVGFVLFGALVVLLACFLRRRGKPSLHNVDAQSLADIERGASPEPPKPAGEDDVVDIWAGASAPRPPARDPARGGNLPAVRGSKWPTWRTK